jgi:hypothetical protein
MKMISQVLAQARQFLPQTLTEIDQRLLFIVDGDNNRYQHRRQLPVRTLKSTV